jgi:hypothetical protein
VSHRVNFVVLLWVARALPSVWIPLTLRDVTGHEMKVVCQRKRVPVDLDELVARGRLAGGLQSSMAIEEVRSGSFILVNFVPSLCPSLRPHVLMLASMALLTRSMQSPFSLFSLHKSIHRLSSKCIIIKYACNGFLCLVNDVIFVAELVGIEVFASLLYNN